MAYIAMAYSYGLDSYGLHSYGPRSSSGGRCCRRRPSPGLIKCSYGLYSYDKHSYGPPRRMEVGAAVVLLPAQEKVVLTDMAMACTVMAISVVEREPSPTASQASLVVT